MTTRSGNLGLSTAAVPLLRDLIHERAGLYYDAARQDTLADRLAPLVVERGFSSFLDYYYLLKYDQDGAAEWPRVMDALAVPEDRKSTRLNSSHLGISYAVFCLKKKKKNVRTKRAK